MIAKNVSAMKWRLAVSIASLALCALLLSTSGAWAANSWNGTTGTLTIDYPLAPLISTDFSRTGGLQQAMQVLAINSLGTVRELIIKPSAAPGGTPATGGVITWEDMWYIATGQSTEASFDLATHGMENVVSIDCTGAHGPGVGAHISEGIGTFLTKLAFLSLPEGIEEIRRGAFISTDLRVVILPESLKSISADVFSDDLRTVVFRGANPSLLTIEPEAFHSASGTLTVIVPPGTEGTYGNILGAAGVNTPVVSSVGTITLTPATLPSTGGTVKASIAGSGFTGQTITVLRDGANPVVTTNNTATLASADVVIPANTGTTAVSHDITVQVNGVLLPDVKATVTVSAPTSPDVPA
ncbi:MAG: leucine-rich repeat domain-containing protein, partial [Synergistaceae bacterium]|nr:leucine-rich repeat domain-containing protein [Synergistaceae bacterium]